MMISREFIAAAVFAKVSNLAGVVTASRKWVHWGDCAPAQQPAIYMRQVGQEVEQQRGIPPKWTLSYELALYAHADDPDAVPSSIQNPLIDAVEYAFRPENGIENVLTLGGTVSHCWIDGEIATDEGLLGQQTVALITVKVLAAI